MSADDRIAALVMDERNLNLICDALQHHAKSYRAEAREDQQRGPLRADRARLGFEAADALEALSEQLSDLAEEVEAEEAGEWTADQCAEAWGVKRGTWNGYVSRGQAPRPKRHIGRTPVWDREKVKSYPRPGQGARTDVATG